MPKYEVQARELVYYTIVVDADDEQHAIEKAKDIRSDEYVIDVDYFEIDSVKEESESA